jgi:hypothetical protein
MIKQDSTVSIVYKLILISLWKESSNSDGHQFHQYQQNINSLITKRLQHNDIGNSGPDLGQAHKCCGVKLVNGILTLFVWYYSMKE